MTPGISRIDAFALAVLALQAALALRLRVVAWPEVTTPGYLWSRGLLMYRDIKLQHTPGTTGALALGFLAFGARAAFLRGFAILPALVAHGFVLAQTRSLRLLHRALASAFFLAIFYASDGNAVWPTPILAALAIPIASELTRRRAVRAGLLFGLAILFKQTAAYALLLAVLWLWAERRRGEAARVFLAACVPYFAALAVFAALGAGGEMLRWTILVPFTIHPAIEAFRPGFWTVATLLIGFLPLAAETARERLDEPPEAIPSARALLVVGAGLALICYPRFDSLQTVASVPCLAVGAARLMSRRPALLSRSAAAFTATLALSRGAVLASGGGFDGKVLFWNDEPAFEALVARLSALPRDTPLHSELWGNVLPRAGLLPPGRLYEHPWFYWFFSVERLGERIREAAAKPGTVVVGYRGAHPDGEAVGPYAIVRIRGREGR